MLEIPLRAGKEFYILLGRGKAVLDRGQHTICGRCLACGMRGLVPLIVLLSHAVSAQFWQQLPDFPGTARDDGAAFSPNGQFCLGTGMEVGWALTSDWWRL